MREIELVVFDCDGVLADSEVISAEVLVAALRRFDIEMDIAYVFDNFVGKSFPGVAALIRSSFDVALPPDFEAGYRAALIDAFATGLKPTGELYDMLASLGRPSCVATSSSPPRAARTLEILGLAERFGASVFTASQVERGKPAPDLFLFAARNMGVAPESCLVIEDSLAGVEAAKAAGMAVWRYVGGSHFHDRNRAREGTPAGVPVFDNWNQFYLMAPDLRAAKDRNG
ncbi:MAG: HAD family hydrolase [Paracoccaceae bacterium]